jgi:hypothetical protein
MLDAQEIAIGAAIKAGGLFRFSVKLEEAEWEHRMLWLRKDVNVLMESDRLEPGQLRAVKAAFRRFVIGGKITVVTATSPHREVAPYGDLKELKDYAPPFVEWRFKPPRHDLRVFGRFIGKDKLVLTSYGLKSLTEKTGSKPIRYKEENQRCLDFFKANKFHVGWVPADIRNSLSEASFG